MKDNYEELYNKYVDGSLTTIELEVVNKLLNEDEAFRAGLQAHKLVHNSLFKLPVIKAPMEISSKIMEKISTGISEKYKKNYFFRSVVITFVVMLFVSFLLFVFSNGNVQSNEEVFSVYVKIQDFFKNIFIKTETLLGGNLIKTIGGVFGFLILLFFYFTLDEYKKFKKILKQF